MNIEQGIMNFEVMLSLKISSFDIPCSLFDIQKGKASGYYRPESFRSGFLRCIKNKK